MYKSFKIKKIEVILLLFIFYLINIFFSKNYYLNKKYQEYIAYLYPINYLLPYLILFYVLICFWNHYNKKYIYVQFYQIKFKYLIIYIILFLLCLYLTNLFINIMHKYTSKFIIHLNNILKIKYNISIKHYLISKKNILQIFNFLYKYPISSSITIGILAPIVEEILFRGIILQGLINNGYTKLHSLLFSSFVFAILHNNFWQIINAYILGNIIGWIYINSKSLIISIILHLINNLNICLFYLFFKINNTFYIKNSILINLVLLILINIISIFFIFLIKKMKIVIKI